jgi:hypothetical protein
VITLEFILMRSEDIPKSGIRGLEGLSFQPHLLLRKGGGVRDQVHKKIEPQDLMNSL